jgi:hypothetical protein
MSTNLYRTCSKVSILIKPSISLALTLELGLLMATTVPMPYCLADFKTDGESSKKMLFALRIYLVTNAHRKTLELKMRVTNLASYFDGIISSHDYDVAKEKQEFWQIRFLCVLACSKNANTKGWICIKCATSSLS